MLAEFPALAILSGQVSRHGGGGEQVRGLHLAATLKCSKRGLKMNENE